MSAVNLKIHEQTSTHDDWQRCHCAEPSSVKHVSSSMSKTDMMTGHTRPIVQAESWRFWICYMRQSRREGRHRIWRFHSNKRWESSRYRHEKFREISEKETDYPAKRHKVPGAMLVYREKLIWRTFILGFYTLVTSPHLQRDSYCRQIMITYRKNTIWTG